jgi:hypothetical protein
MACERVESIFGFQEYFLTRRAKQGYGGIIATVPVDASVAAE